MHTVADAWHERAADTLIGLVSPRTAALRKHRRAMDRDADYRRAFDLGARTRGYKKPDENATRWLDASNRSADAEILPELAELRARARMLNRTNALATGITDTLVRGVAGTGLRPQARTNSDAKDDALESVWAARKDTLAQGEGNLTHGAWQRLCYGKRVEDGELFKHPAMGDGGLFIEAIESDRVCSPHDAKPLDPAGRIVDGVEKDASGRVVAYWILKQHPGDVLSGRTRLGKSAMRPRAGFTSADFIRVEERDCYHDRAKVRRPGQTRGVPALATVEQDLHDLDLLLLATLKRTQIAACLAVFLTSDAPMVDLVETTAAEYGYQLDADIEPGMIWRSFPGEKVEFLNPSSGLPDLGQFVMLLARRIGAAVGLSPQAVIRAWDGITYSGARTIKIDDRMTLRVDRADFAPSLTWEWRVVLEHELLEGNPTLVQAGITLEDIQRVEWIGDEEPWVDPTSEAQAISMMLSLGLTTYQAECARLGRDWQANIRERVAAAKFLAETLSAAGLEASALAADPASVAPVTPLPAPTPEIPQGVAA